MAKYTEEQLNHYISHPDEVDATDSDLVEALAAAELAGLGVTEGDKVDEKSTDTPNADEEDAKRAKAEAEAKVAAEEKAATEAKAKADAEAKAKAEAAKGAKGEGEGEVTEGTRVLTQDGKNTMPFSVVKEARERAQGAEEALAEANKNLVAISEQLKAARAGKDADTDGKTEDELDQMIESVSGEAPWIKDAMTKIVGAVREARSQIEELQGRNQETDEQARARLQTHARTALEANPTLVLWQAEAPDLYDEAVTFDALVRKDPTLTKLYPTFEKRFNAVVEMVKTAHDGEEIPLPQPVKKTDAELSKKDAPAGGQPSAADIQARAQAALAKAKDETVRTLSDIPGGEGEVSDIEALERMSPEQLAAKFEGMKSSQDILNWVMAHTTA